MLGSNRVAVVMPAYNAAKTLEQTYRELPLDVVDTVILTDDGSTDDTAARARALGLNTIVHPQNRGYGGNQKTCYREALATQADIIVMVHPDYQYSPKLVVAMASMIASGHYDLVLASRILGGNAIDGGMPFYKYVSNRVLTAVQNLVCEAKLSEYHTGFRAYSRRLLETIPFDENSDDFVFDNQLIVQSLLFGFQVGEISCPTRYFAEASSINFRRSVVYGLGVLKTALSYRLEKSGAVHFPIFKGKPQP
ncbi:MAG: glycosyltransferase family 2 protein [Deltaproteobacteria bacterium]|nr:glycosyltransferase family 2 protein [Deltaproteobacteria bacterium]